MKKTTKLFAMLLFVLSLTTLTSCKKTNEQLIIGKWDCITATIIIDNEMETIPQGFRWILDFNNDGVVSSEYYQDGLAHPTITTSKYIISENQISFTSFDGEGSSIYSIKELTNKKLAIETSEGNNSAEFEFKRL